MGSVSELSAALSLLLISLTLSFLLLLLLLLILLLLLKLLLLLLISGVEVVLFSARIGWMETRIAERAT